MRRGGLRLSVAVAAGLMLLAAVVPAYASPFLTTSLTQTAISQGTLGGYPGVFVTYNDTSTTSFDGFVYLALLNSTGQTVYLSIATCKFVSNHNQSCFLAVPSTVPSGAYTAKVFATMTENVPVSATGSIQVTV